MTLIVMTRSNSIHFLKTGGKYQCCKAYLHSIAVIFDVPAWCFTYLIIEIQARVWDSRKISDPCIEIAPTGPTVARTSPRTAHMIDYSININMNLMKMHTED